MSELLAYLGAQAARHPLVTARFVTGELWRRGRLRFLQPQENSFPAFAGRALGERFAFLRPPAPWDAERFAAEHPGAQQRICDAADRVCRKELEIFGERVTFNGSFNWHTDWVSGHHWRVTPAAEIRLLGAPAGADIKRPWELARLHHLVPLAQGFALTGRLRYAAEFASQVLDWIASNPYARGIHWAMPMEAAIRAINVAMAAAWFNGAGGSEMLDDRFWQRLLGSLFQHGRYVFAHREWNAVARGNHYLSCVAGLCWLGALFSDTGEGQEWLQLGRRGLAEEMRAQVGEDGVAHEGSSGYHLFVTELFLAAALAVARHEEMAGRRSSSPRESLRRAWGTEFSEKLAKMFEFPAAILSGRERAPNWGDCDSGRVLPLCSGDADPASHVIALGAAIFADARRSAAHPCEEAWWRLGPSAGGTPAGPASDTSADAAFSQAGFYFFQSPRLRGSVRCGPLGINGWASHAHCDQLSFELCSDGRPVVIDPGTYLYSGDRAGRNELRSTRAHNTPYVEGAEQNRFWPGLLFRMVDDTRSRLLRWRPDADQFEFAGEHYGFRRLPQRVTVTRRLTLHRAQNILRAVDTLAGRGRARVEWNFTLAPGIAPQEADASTESNLHHEMPERTQIHSCWRLGALLMEASAEDAGGLAASLELGWYAPRYGQRVRVAVLRFSGELALPATVAFRFAPASETT